MDENHVVLPGSGRPPYKVLVEFNYVDWHKQVPETRRAFQASGYRYITLSIRCKFILKKPVSRRAFKVFQPINGVIASRNESCWLYSV